MQPNIWRIKYWIVLWKHKKHKKYFRISHILPLLHKLTEPHITLQYITEQHMTLRLGQLGCVENHPESANNKETRHGTYPHTMRLPYPKFLCSGNIDDWPWPTVCRHFLRCFKIRVNLSLRLITYNCSNDNISALVQVGTWHLSGGEISITIISPNNHNSSFSKTNWNPNYRSVKIALIHHTVNLKPLLRLERG